MQNTVCGLTNVLEQAMKADTMSAVAEERDKEVRNILQSIGDLTNIMKDLSVLVINQGTILDRIDYNMDQVSKFGHCCCVLFNVGMHGKICRKSVCYALRQRCLLQ